MKVPQIPNVAYKPKQFDLSGLKGISDKTLEMHFKLYEGYVKETNRLSEQHRHVPRGRHRSIRRRCPPTPSSAGVWASSTTAWCCTSSTSAT